MNLPPIQVVLIVVGAFAALVGLAYLDRTIPSAQRAFYRIGVTLLVAVGFFYGVQALVPDISLGADVVKGVIAGVAAACVFYEVYREGMRRPVAERWKKLV